MKYISAFFMAPAQEGANPLVTFLPLLLTILIFILIVRFVRSIRKRIKINVDLSSENDSIHNKKISTQHSDVKCVNCSKAIEPDSKYCSNCGEKQST